MTLTIEQGNYDSAVTKARTLLEEVFCYVIEKNNEVPSDSGDIGKLYKKVRSVFGMQTGGDIDSRVNKLLSGLNSIVAAIGEMRNKAGDAHGVGSSRILIEKRHARLAVNSAITMAEYILSLEKK